MDIKPLDKRNNEWIVLNNSKMIKINKFGIDYYIFAMNVKEVKDLVVEDSITMLDSGYSYIQILPIKKNYTLIMNYNKHGDIIRWTFVINYSNFLDERGLPFYEESGIKIVVDKKLNVIELGRDKVELDFSNKIISKEQYELIIRQTELIKVGIKENIDILKKVSNKYFNLFFRTNKNKEVDNRNTYRVNIKSGTKVAIVLKKDQKTGILTEGIVKDILTKSIVHHRGIKVRLEDGQVGRVQKILD